MNIRRVVPDVHADDLEAARGFYGDFLGLEVGMDLDWVLGFVSPDNPTAQVIVMRDDRSAPVNPDMTIEVAEVDHLHERAQRLGYEIVHPLTDEPWGVRRFFVKDPSGTIINVMSHAPAS